MSETSGNLAATSRAGEDDARQLWVVGARVDDIDMTARFVDEGLWWCSAPDQRDVERIQAMRPGDRIAIKASFVQKQGLPFDNRGLGVSVMRIKARGVIERVEGTQVYAAWERLEPARDWYFFTYMRAISRVNMAKEMARKLEAFIFDDVPQDHAAFLADPYWSDRYRERVVEAEPMSDEFDWIPFTMALADELVVRRSSDRGELVDLVSKVRARHGGSPWQDRFKDGTAGPMTDIDPGTIMTIFNLGPTPLAKRRLIAADLAQTLGLDLEPPTNFAGIPVTFPMAAWHFMFAKDRGPDDIERLWDVYEAALAWADDQSDAQKRAAFEAALTAALLVSNWTLCTTLYRMRPLVFMPMDGNTQRLVNALDLATKTPAYVSESAAKWYLASLDQLHEYLGRSDAPVHTMPEFSDWAFQCSGDPNGGAEPNDEDDGTAPGNRDRVDSGPATEESVSQAYGIDELMADGCFVERREIERMVDVLRRTKNLVLQGAPGTGKTWLAKRLGWVMAGCRPTDCVQVVQFHPNTSYEDFVRGYRPIAGEDGGAGLRLVDGPFLRLADQAKTAHVRAEGRGEVPQAHTMVIEEINRGNPARALGEMLTLLEASKRFPAEAIKLTYERPEFEGQGVWLPENLYTIGTMNIADRSLALVDLALRRRFAFVTLEPNFNDAWRAWVLPLIGGDERFVGALCAAVKEMNGAIRQDSTLGASFVVGHSYFTPDGMVEHPGEWLRDQVEWALKPLLQEYWFDHPDRVDRALRLFDEVA